VSQKNVAAAIPSTMLAATPSARHGISEDCAGRWFRAGIAVV
jgi:hypothetical protein